MTGAGRVVLGALLSRDAARLGRRMAALYRCWDRRGGPDLSAWAGCLLGAVGGQGTPVGQACLHAAAAVQNWGGHPYHSARHHAEVATNAVVLAALADEAGQPIAPARRALLLAAALAHDLGYEPARQPRPRFAAEAASAAAMDAIAARCGVRPAERDDLRVLILATEPASRTVLATLPDDDVPSELQALTTRPDLAALALVLSDADLLSSAGLTVGWHAVQLGRLERELGQAIAPADDLAFLDHVVGTGFIGCGGKRFDPNLQRIRESVRRQQPGEGDRSALRRWKADGEA